VQEKANSQVRHSKRLDNFQFKMAAHCNRNAAKKTAEIERKKLTSLSNCAQDTSKTSKISIDNLTGFAFKAMQVTAIVQLAKLTCRGVVLHSL
jgi:hypothetical protein